MPYYVYILASRSRTLYTGVTNDVVRRVAEHRRRRPGSFTARYRIRDLVYYEAHPRPMLAIRREKQIKTWTREKRMALIERHNYGWLDLAADWYPRAGRRSR